MFEDIVYNGIMFLSKDTRSKINSVVSENPDADYHEVEIAGRMYIVQVSLNTTVGEIAEFDGYVLIV
jgi:hypothetical protein